jgi:hypothetical protein
MELKPHQARAVKETPDRWGLWWRMRVGKTPTAIRIACDRCKVAIIVCPKSLVSNWGYEIERWRLGDCKFIVISKETFRRDWDKLERADGIFIDEVHSAFANFKTQAFKAMTSYLNKHSPRVIIPLTGTPFTSSSWSVYSYGKLLGKDWKWFDWYRRFFYEVKMGPRKVPMPKQGMEAELQVILRRLGTVIDLKDVADVLDDEDIIETFSLNKEQNKAIEDAFDPMPAKRYVRQHQLESGTLKGDGYVDTKFIDCEKDKRLIELVRDNNKIIIVSRYLAQLDKYEKMFKGRKIFKISGQEQRTASEVASLAEREKNCICLIQGDTVAGYNLQSFNIVVFASMSYSFVNYDQVRFRTKNMEKKTPCTYIHLLTEGDSIDRAVYDCVIKKQDFSFELFNNKV